MALRSPDSFFSSLDTTAASSASGTCFNALRCVLPMKPRPMTAIFIRGKYNTCDGRDAEQGERSCGAYNKRGVYQVERPIREDARNWRHGGAGAAHHGATCARGHDHGRTPPQDSF